MSSRFRPETAADLAAAFARGERSPVEVVDRALEAVRASDLDTPPMRAVVHLLAHTARTQAEASAERWRRGAPLSPLDGVPLVVKDMLDIAGHPTTVGTRLPFPLPERDAFAVERLAAAGAIVIGKANMHEMGAGTTGINPHFGTPRNPYDPARWCGGSSSGSACAVGAGLVPIAVGTDAGGSIRAPAAFVGAVGLKPTFGRISRAGMPVLCDTLDTIGPMATTCADAATLLLALGGVNPDDDETWDQPPLPPYGAAALELARPVDGLRIGVPHHVFDHPSVDPRVAELVVEAGRALADAGAELVDVTLPDPEQSRLVGLVILGAEGPSGLEHLLERNRDLLGADLQVLLAVGAHFSARDYLKAQRIRNQIRRQWSDVLAEVDLVLLPSAGVVAGLIRPDALDTGELDEAASAGAISHTFPSNLTGLPALSVPCGFVDGLPVGAQLVGRAWHELTCLRAGAALEAARLFEPRRPARWYGAG